MRKPRMTVAEGRARYLENGPLASAPLTPEEQLRFAQQIQNHRHNGYWGSLRMAQSFVRNLQDSVTVTDDAKRWALTVEKDLSHLEVELEQRVIVGVRKHVPRGSGERKPSKHRVKPIGHV